MNKAAIWVAAAVALIVGAGYLGSPFYTVAQLRAAARTADRDRLEQLVSFPEVREHLKSQVDNRLQKELSGKEGALASLGALLGPAVSNRLIDKVITSDGVAAIIRSGRAARAAAWDEAAGDPSNPPQQSPKLQITTRYKDLDHFILTIRDSRDPQNAAAVLTLTRRGLFAWQVTEIHLPSLDKPGSATN